MSRSVQQSIARLAIGLTALSLIGAGLAACAPPTKEGGIAGSPDGALVLGAIGGATDSIDPYAEQNSAINEARTTQIFDGLTYREPKGKISMALAESMDPNSDNTEWIVKLKKDVKLHNGKTFSADDVVASVKRMLDPEQPYAGASPILFINPSKVTKVDDLTVRFVLDKPYGPFPDVWANTRVRMAHWKGGKPIGTGPFTPDSFTAGQESVFTRFDDYWGDKPGFTTLRIIDFQDQPAITNALRGGQIDVAYAIPFTDAATLDRAPDIKLLESKNGAFHLGLEMRTDIPPFNDPRVREAMKLIVDRKQVVDNAFGGYATIGNDYAANSDSCPPPKLPQRKQDIAKAKQLLSEAGNPAIDIELVTNGGQAGMTELTQLFAQQAAGVGINVTAKKLDTATFLNEWREWPFYINYYRSPYLTIVANSFLPGGEENASHFDDREYNDLAAELFAESNPKAQCALIERMHTIEYERSGVIVPAYLTVITAYNTKVSGLKPDDYGRAAFQFAGVTVNK